MEIGKTFCGRTDGRTDGRTHLSSNLLGHRRGDDLKITVGVNNVRKILGFSGVRVRVRLGLVLVLWLV